MPAAARDLLAAEIAARKSTMPGATRGNEDCALFEVLVSF